MDVRRTAQPRADLDVRVTGGVVRGTTANGIHAWRGVPYATPPVDQLRFRAPRPVAAWSGIRNASAYGNVAPQLYKGQFRGTGPGIPAGEDCLTVNVLTSANVAPSQAGLPVMVFIHGGGYSVGSSQDFPGQGESFVTTGKIIYVSFNYRLGALGYLHFTRYSSRKRPIESNLGLRDQVAALRWVRNNIRAFGGDPHNVTVFGQSAGANAVTTLMTVPSARGLFARAIAESSPPNAVYARALADRWAADFVEALRNERASADASSHTQQPADLLSSATATQLASAALVLQLRSPDDAPGTFCLAPTVDGDVLPERPVDAFRHGNAHRIPLIIGTTDREGSIFRGRVDILPRTAGRIRTIFERAPRPARQRMVIAYPGLPAVRPAADFGGDYAFWYPSVVVAERHARYAPVHMYRFDTAPRLMHLLGIDATHGIELFALFDQVNTPLGRTVGAFGGLGAFARAGERMRRYWLDFAETGTVNDTWPRYSDAERLTLIINESDHVESDPRHARRIAWRSFLPEL